MFLEYLLKEDREQQCDHSYAHEDKDTESYYLNSRIYKPGKTDAERNGGKENGGREVCYCKQERILDYLFDRLVKPSDDRECIAG